MSSNASSSLYDLLKELDPQVTGLAEFEFRGDDGRVLGWHSHVQRGGAAIVAGGTASDRMLARRKAVAEGLERAVVESLRSRPSAASVRFGMHLDATSEGFAVGFEKAPTSLRAICEGIEFAVRQGLLSQRVGLEEVRSPSLDSMAESIRGEFDRVRFLRSRRLSVDSTYDLPSLDFHMVVGTSGTLRGTGFRVSRRDQGWTHALIEASRNLENVRLLLAGTEVFSPVGKRDLLSFANFSIEKALANPVDPSLTETLFSEEHWLNRFHLCRSIFALRPESISN